MIGRIIAGNYRVDRLLGQGGMGTVYAATHERTGRRLAIKVLPIPENAQQAHLGARFEREARAAGAIDSQHVAQVLDFGHDEAARVLYLVMEYLEGEDLARALARTGPLPPSVAARIAAQALVGLEKAHALDIIHRDIKPANIFLVRRDEGEVRVVLLDFGIAKVINSPLDEADNGALTRTGSILGSPTYMSPEQARGLRTIDRRADLWSLGAVLYEMLTGRTPHDGSDTLGSLILAICTTPARPVTELAPWVPAALCAVVERALAIVPSARFAGATAMLDALRGAAPGGFSLRADEIAPRAQGEVLPPPAPADQSGVRLGAESAIVAAPGKVLIVDDSRTMRRLLATHLTEGGLTSDGVGSGEEALEILRRDPDAYDAVVLDVSLPGMDGFEVLQHLAADPRASAIPVLLVTAHSTTEHDMVRGLRAGAVDHLPKPFAPAVLVAKVQAFSERRRAGRARAASS